MNLLLILILLSSYNKGTAIFNGDVSKRASDVARSFTHLILRAVQVEAAPYLRGVNWTAQDPMDPVLGQQHLLPNLDTFSEGFKFYVGFETGQFMSYAKNTAKPNGIAYAETVWDATAKKRRMLYHTVDTSGNGLFSVVLLLVYSLIFSLLNADCSIQ